MATVPRRRLSLLARGALMLVALLALAPLQARATSSTTPICLPGAALGAAANFNVFVLGNINQPSSDTEGRMAAGGNVTLASYSVGYSLSRSNPLADALVVGGNLSFNGGRVYNGNAVYAGSANVSGSTSVDGKLTKGSPVNFAAEASSLKSQSAAMAALPANGSATLQWGGLTLTGSDSKLNIFAVQGSVIASIHTLNIKAPAGSTVIVNIDGATAQMQNFGFFLTGVQRTNILYNFYQATTLKLQGIGIEGSILAPKAAISFNSGNINGTLIGASLEGIGESHHYPPAINVPVCSSTPTSTPVPPTKTPVPPTETPVPPTATPVPPTPTPDVKLPPDQSLCKYEPGWIPVVVEVSLPEGQQAVLQTNWYIVQPDDLRTDPAYQLHGLVKNGDKVTVEIFWPGIRPTDPIVEIHLGAIPLDPLTLNPIMGRGASLDYYWYPWVCPAPTSAPTSTPVPTSTSLPTNTPVPTNTSPTNTPTPAPQGAISGRVWADQNFTGTQETYEAGIAGTEVRLYRVMPDGQEVYISSVTTDASGNYSFPALADGTYTLYADEGFYYISTTPNPTEPVVVTGAPVNDVNIGLFRLGSS